MAPGRLDRRRWPAPFPGRRRGAANARPAGESPAVDAPAAIPYPLQRLALTGPSRTKPDATVATPFRMKMEPDSRPGSEPSVSGVQRSVLRDLPMEAVIWIAGIAVLYFAEAGSPDRLDLCLFHRLGLGPCPGCGLGASIHHLLHGDLAASWGSHPLGVPALGVVAARSVRLLSKPISEGYRRLRFKGA